VISSTAEKLACHSASRIFELEHDRAVAWLLTASIATSTKPTKRIVKAS
jgi:hypothetical protein